MMPKQPDDNLDGLKSIDALRAALHAGERGIVQALAVIRFDLSRRNMAIASRDASGGQPATDANIERHARFEGDIIAWGAKTKRDAAAAIEIARKMHADLVHLQHSIDASDSL
jgi:hypothetical protein